MYGVYTNITLYYVLKNILNTILTVYMVTGIPSTATQAIYNVLIQF